MIPEKLPRPKSSKKRLSKPSSNIFGPPIIRPKSCRAKESKVNKSTAFEQNVTVRIVKQKKSVAQVESSSRRFNNLKLIFVFFVKNSIIIKLFLLKVFSFQ